jgi:hypothetical protein
METWIVIALTSLTTVIASSGFWAWITARGQKNSASTQLMMGIAHDRIVYLTQQYLERKWITREEYNNLYKFLYLPYKKLGGNGVLEHLIDLTKKLEMRSMQRVIERTQNEPPA